MNTSPTIESTNQIINYLKDKGIAHMNVDGSHIYGNILKINGKELINFGSCSYLGLEFEDSMKAGAMKTIEVYGTQFSSSRAYVSAGMYEELEKKLEIIFDGHVLVTPTTTLGHISTIPTLIGRNDCVIMDHQVHNSVQTAVKLAKADGAHVEMVRHNRMDLLESRIKKLTDKYETIWYMADGIYSMFGDKAPMKELEVLLNKYEKFYLYVDDAHAMSCFGKHGRGYALSEIDLHSKMVLGTSLNKAYASGGGAFVFPNLEMYNKVKNCGGPMITSGPMQPSALGAALAAADIHLSDEIYTMQSELRENILYCHHLLEMSGLPNLAEKESPIFFVGVGAPKPAYDLIDRLIKDGFLVNIGIFPAVPMKNTGLRFTITRLHTFEQIELFVQKLAQHYYQVLDDHQTGIDEVCKAFKIEIPKQICALNANHSNSNTELKVELYQTIMDVDKDEWNKFLGKNGSFDWIALNLLENSFSNNELEEQNYSFEYLTIKDSDDQIVLSTFFSSGLMKDDMLMEKEISITMEEIRRTQPLYACSRFLSIGCMITEGEHFYFDKSHKDAQLALRKFYAVVDDLRKKYDATQVILRDFRADDPEMDAVMVDNGYFKIQMPDNNIVDLSHWNIEDCYSSILSKRSSKHFRQAIKKNADKFIVNRRQKVSDKDLRHYFELYKNVQSQNMSINTFELPYSLFQEMNNNQNWEFIELKLVDGFGYDEAVSVVFGYKGLKCYSPTMMGMDYSVDRSLNVYRQSVYQAIRAGKINGYDEIRLGFSAAFEKKKLGANAYPCSAYMQSSDHFSTEALMVVQTNSNKVLVNVE